MQENPSLGTKTFVIFLGIMGAALLLLLLTWPSEAPPPEPPVKAKFIVATTTEKASPARSSVSTITSTSTEEVTATSTFDIQAQLPAGAAWHFSGGLARNNCDAIVDTEIQEKCKGERAIEQYIYSIAPGSQITKGFCLPETAFDDPRNHNWCTDLSDFKTNTVHEIKNILTKIISHCQEHLIADCGIIVTGGSEFGHKGEELGPDGSIVCVDQASHCGGKKIDLRLTEGLQSLVETEFVPMPDRDFDGAPQWKDVSNGNVYALEPDHWDILVP